MKLTKKKAPGDIINNSEKYSKSPDLDSRLQALGISRRELEVLALIAQGFSNQEIADRLFVSLNTIKTHSSNLFIKLNVRRRTQAVQRAKELGLIPI